MGATDSEWGDWVLGDLADTLTEIARIIGNSTEITWARMAAPMAPGAIPTVVVAVPDRGELFRLRSELAECGHPVMFDVPATGQSFNATLPGLARLRLEAER